MRAAGQVADGLAVGADEIHVLRLESRLPDEVQRPLGEELADGEICGADRGRGCLAQGESRPPEALGVVVGLPGDDFDGCFETIAADLHQGGIDPVRGGAGGETGVAQRLRR